MIKNKVWDTIVIGAGAAGTMAAIMAGRQGQSVLLIEKNEKVGKKLYITGKGRCNLTNADSPEEILKNIPCNSKFLYGAIYTFTSHQLMAFFEEAGCSLKIERGNRVFPQSDKSVDILNTLDKELKKSSVTVYKERKVVKILTEEVESDSNPKYADTFETRVNKTCDKSLKYRKEEYVANLQRKIIGIQLSNGQQMKAKRLILATGGMSYPSTGSDGDGHKFAEELGHQIVPVVPALVPLETRERDFSELSPLLLKNVDLYLKKQGKVVYTERGEVQFTKFGLSGALVLTASCHLPKELQEKWTIQLDLKPALSVEQLNARILREIEAHSGQTIEEALASLLPMKLFATVLKRCNISGFKRVAEMSKEERQRLVNGLKNLEFEITDRRSFREAIITRGGVNVKEINPKTMESKKVKGLYVVGELLDVDAFTGGYNLQIAFSTGYLAGIQEISE